MKEDLEETKEFLALAIDDKKILKEENNQIRKELQKYNQLINKNKDQTVIIEEVEKDQEYNKWDL